MVNKDLSATTLNIIHESNNIDDDAVTKFSLYVKQLCYDFSTDNRFTIEAISYELLFQDSTATSSTDFELIDAVVLPIAILILGVTVQSSRMMLISLVLVCVSVLGSFLIMYPISIFLTINSFTPSIMVSIGIAMSFDYSLFLCSRFREEIVNNKKGVFEAVAQAMNFAGHVVVVSGSCLSFTFLVLVFLPDPFLVSTGITSFITLWLSIFAAMSLFPALIFSFPDFFTNFEFIPAFCYNIFNKNKENEDYNRLDLEPLNANVVRSEKCCGGCIGWRKISQFVVTPLGAFIVMIIVLAISLPIGIFIFIF